MGKREKGQRRGIVASWARRGRAAALVKYGGGILHISTAFIQKEDAGSCKLISWSDTDQSSGKWRGRCGMQLDSVVPDESTALPHAAVPFAPHEGRTGPWGGVNWADGMGWTRMLASHSRCSDGP